MARQYIKEVTKTTIVRAALTVAERDGFLNLTQKSIAEVAQCSYGTITGRCGTMTNSRRDVMRAAVLARSLGVIASGLAIKHPTALKAPKELRDAAAATLSA